MSWVKLSGTPRALIKGENRSMSCVIMFISWLQRIGMEEEDSEEVEDWFSGTSLSDVEGSCESYCLKIIPEEVWGERPLGARKREGGTNVRRWVVSLEEEDLALEETLEVVLRIGGDWLGSLEEEEGLILLETTDEKLKAVSGDEVTCCWRDREEEGGIGEGNYYN